MNIILSKTFSFDSAHWLPTFPEGHKCRRLHGHTFYIDVLVEGPVPADQGYLMDYGDIKAAIEPIKQQLDHRLLNEIEGLNNPTAEILAKWIFDHLKPQLPQLTVVRVRETCTSMAEYHGR